MLIYEDEEKQRKEEEKKQKKEEEKQKKAADRQRKKQEKVTSHFVFLELYFKCLVIQNTFTMYFVKYMLI